MNFFEHSRVASEISVAIFVPHGAGTPLHRNRPTHGLAMCYGKSAVFRFEGGRELICRSGDIIYLPRYSNYETYDLSAEDGCEAVGTYAINFLIDGEELTEYSPEIIRIRGKDEAYSAFSRATAAYCRMGEGDAEECFIDLYRILRLIRRERAKYSPVSSAKGLLAPAIEYINNNYTKENIEVGRLAELCGISQSYLRRLFARAFSVSPAIYMRNMRIRYAKELLKTGDYTVSAAAELSGFNDTAYFSREFKKATGYLPSSLLP